MVGVNSKMFRAFLYLLPLLFLNQVIFANEGAKWIESDLSALSDEADSGDAYALGFLALCHLHGDKGLSVSHLEARFYAENSASRGHWLGNFVLGYLTRYKPMGPDSALVAKYLLKSFREPDGKLIKQAAIGDPVASYVMAEIFLSEEIQNILQPDMQMAAGYYDISSRSGYGPASIQSALIRLHDLTDSLSDKSASEKEGIRLLQKAVDQKLPAAHHYLGTCFLEGLGVEEDKSLAMVHFQASADRGYGPAQVILADFYAYGYASQPNEKLALEYIQRAVDIYQEGAEKKFAEYQQLFRPETEQIDDFSVSENKDETPDPTSPPQSKITVSQISDELPKYSDRSLRLPSPYASSQRSPESKLTENSLHTKQIIQVDNELFKEANTEEASINQIRENAKKIYWGRTSGESMNQAFNYFEKCANLGDAESARYLGIMYLRGKGIEKDVGESMKWLEFAASKGDDLAQKNLVSLRKIMGR